MRRHHAGFSLIEILAAFSIAAVALAVIFQIYSKGTTSALLGHDYTVATSIARSRLDALGTSEELNAPGSHGTELDRFHWEVRVAEFEPPEPMDYATPIELKSVFVEVSWQTLGKEYSVSLQSLKPVATPL